MLDMLCKLKTDLENGTMMNNQMFPELLEIALYISLNRWFHWEIIK